MNAKEVCMSHLAFARLIAVVLAAGALTVAAGQAWAGVLPVEAGLLAALALALVARLLGARG